jgi:flagellar basal body-associated protein FliL
MTGNYTPLNIDNPKKKSGSHINIVLITIALVITLVLGGALWYMIEQKKLEEANPHQEIVPQQTIRNVQIESSPTPIASPTADLTDQSPTPSAAITPQATQSGALQP